MKRNNKYIGLTLGIYFSSMIVAIGAIVLVTTHSFIGAVIMFLAIPAIITAVIIGTKDTELNKDFDKEEHDKEQWLEYKRLKDKYDNKNPPK
jgi:ABC-type transport system involved in cytochrome bd biosynthesis fused ATPase/permease subunit